jgi:hypothetical protein
MYYNDRNVYAIVGSNVKADYGMSLNKVEKLEKL